MSVLNWQQSWFNLLIFVPFVKTPKLLKFSIMTQMQLLGFVLGARPQSCICRKTPICCDIWNCADCLCCAIWYAEAARLDLLLWSWLVRLSLWITEISWEANGQVQFLSNLVPVSNWVDCEQNLQAASESAQWLPWWEWRSWTDLHLWPCNSWPRLPFRSLLR